jgi:hypothetical protein
MTGGRGKRKRKMQKTNILAKTRTKQKKYPRNVCETSSFFSDQPTAGAGGRDRRAPVRGLTTDLRLTDHRSKGKAVRADLDRS